MSITALGYYLPGEIINEIKSKDKQSIIGPGLRRNEEKTNQLQITQAGTLYFRAPNTYWVESRRKRYIPKKGDLVVGIVIKKTGDSVRIDLGSAEFASLSLLAFEGATKKMKPELNIGDVVYGKLLNAHKEMEPEIVCVDQYYKAGSLGVLSNDGFLITLNLNLIHSLLDPANPLLKTLSKKFPFEIVIGVNGKVWIKANKTRDILTLCKAFEAASNQCEKDIVEVCRQFK